ncbi:MAG: thioredoxin family protein, partial [Prevotellaceae bacterium]|nr:thioredoxin family protein [Prevotellaceae bacterium]
EHVSIPRFALSAASFCFALYLFTGLLGNPLSALSGFLPQNSVMKTAQKNNSEEKLATFSGQYLLCNITPKHSELGLSGPANLPSFFDLNEGLSCAKQQGKNVLLAFKGRTCSNCKKMDGEAFSDQRVQDLLLEKYVIIALYLDDKTELLASEWYTSAFDGKTKKTIGDTNKDYLITRYHVNAMPYFATLDSDGKMIGKPVGYVGTSEFLEFLLQKN